MKTTKKLIIGIILMFLTVSLFDSCQKKLNDPVTHTITYLLVNYSPSPTASEFYIKLADPKYANQAVFHYDNITSWRYEIKADNGYPCYFEVYSKDDNAQFAIYIQQGESVVAYTTPTTVPNQNIQKAELSYFVQR